MFAKRKFSLAERRFKGHSRSSEMTWFDGPRMTSD